MNRALSYLLVGVLAIFLGASFTYIRLNINNFKTAPKTLETEKTKEPTAKLDDSIKFKTTEAKDDKTVEQIYDLTINGIKKRLTVVFTLKEEKEVFGIEGKINDLDIFYYSGDKTREKIEETFTSEFIKNLFNLDNFSLIKGLDGKNYLTVFNYENNLSIRNYYIFNQELTLLNADRNINILDEETNIVLEGGADIWYKDTYELCSKDSTCHIKSKIEKNKIYNLIPKLEEAPTENNYGVLEEYIIMLDHDSLITDLISTYKIVNVQSPMAP